MKRISLKAMLRRLLLLAELLSLTACHSAPPSPYIWKEFVTARGHANPIPAQWVATPEGRFAHELVIPNPVPADSGYRKGMSAGESPGVRIVVASTH